MDRAEIVGRLEEIASEGKGIAQIQALKMLLALSGEGKSAEGDPFAGLDTDELAGRRQNRPQAA